MHFSVVRKSYHTPMYTRAPNFFSRSFASAYVYMHLDGRIQAIGSAGKSTQQSLGAEEDGDPLPQSDPSGEVRARDWGGG